MFIIGRNGVYYVHIIRKWVVSLKIRCFSLFIFMASVMRPTACRTPSELDDCLVRLSIEWLVWNKENEWSRTNDMSLSSARWIILQRASQRVVGVFNDVSSPWSLCISFHVCSSCPLTSNFALGTASSQSFSFADRSYCSISIFVIGAYTWIPHSRSNEGSCFVQQCHDDLRTGIQDGAEPLRTD